MPQDILTVNQGSSSLKFAVFQTCCQELVLRIRGEIDRIHDLPQFCVKDDQHQVVAQARWDLKDAGHEPAFNRLLEWLRSYRGSGHLKAIGHRVVHGGSAFTAPVLIDDRVLAALEEYVPLAPLHQGHNLAGIRALRAVEPEVPQVACFDTAFHTTIPKVATRFALPLEYEAQGVRRFGFHGLSYEYVATELRRVAPQLARGRVIAAHLGSGTTLCALQNGQSVDTTTGFTELDGLPMETRCGAIDPGVLLHLMRARDFGVDKLERLLFKESGLLGLSGVSGSVQDLLDSEDPRALEALDYFVYRTTREIGALTCSLGGLDALVFTGGIGEHAAAVRSWICARLRWLGIRLDEAANARDAYIVSLPESAISVRVVPANEELMIAQHTAGLLGHSHQQLQKRSA